MVEVIASHPHYPPTSPDHPRPPENQVLPAIATIQFMIRTLHYPFPSNGLLSKSRTKRTEIGPKTQSAFSPAVFKAIPGTIIQFPHLRRRFPRLGNIVWSVLPVVAPLLEVTLDGRWLHDIMITTLYQRSRPSIE